MLHAQEKLYFILNVIADKRHITPSGKRIKIDVTRDVSGSFTIDDLENIFEMLATDKDVLRVFEKPSYPIDSLYGKYTYYLLELTDKFDPYYAEIQQESEYQKFSGKRSPSVKTQEVPERSLDNQNAVYEVKYSEKARKILVNNFLLAEPDFNRENEIVFTYIYSHPNERISKERIERDTGATLTKTLPKILENLGFIGELRKVFFDVSSEGILFRNHVTRKDLQELGVEYLRLK